MRRFSLLAPICVCTLSAAYGDVMKLPAATRRMQSQPFVTTPGCEDQCSRIDINNNECRSDDMRSCICVSSTDKYCGYECDENDNLLMMCLSRGYTRSPTMVHKPFVTTPGCEDQCSRIDINNNECRSEDMRSCLCASSTDKYCGYECDENDNLLMMCLSRGDTRSPTMVHKPFVTTPGCEDQCSRIDINNNECRSEDMRSCLCASSTDKYCGYECDGNDTLSMMCLSRGDTRSPTKAPKNKKGTKDKTTKRPKPTKGPKASKVPKSSEKGTKTPKSKSSKSKNAKS